MLVAEVPVSVRSDGIVVPGGLPEVDPDIRTDAPSGTAVATSATTIVKMNTVERRYAVAAFRTELSRSATLPCARPLEWGIRGAATA